MVETKEEKRCRKTKRITAAANQVDQRLWEEEGACGKRRQAAEDDALNSWKNNRRLWKGSEVDKEMALMRERVKMRQMQEKMRLVTQPVFQEVEANLVEFEEDQRFISEEISGDDSISSMQSRSVQPVEIEQSLEESYPSGKFKPNNHLMNTPPATASICSRKMMERSMASLEAILKDIIEAVKVAWND